MMFKKDIKIMMLFKKITKIIFSSKFCDNLYLIKFILSFKLGYFFKLPFWALAVAVNNGVGCRWCWVLVGLVFESKEYFKLGFRLGCALC